MLIRLRPLPYCDLLDPRRSEKITLVVIHCTELPDLASARIEGEIARYPSGTGNSGHYYVDRDACVEEYVPIERIAHHTRGYNPQSIGIELVNLGRYPDWLASRHQSMNEAYPDVQIEVLQALLSDLQSRCPGLIEIAGHEDLDLTEVPASDDPSLQVRRKRDPGPLFPWSRVVARSGLRRFGELLPPPRAIDTKNTRPPAR